MSAEKNLEADQVLQFVRGSLHEGNDFVMEQAPDVVQQFLVWQFWMYLTYTMFCVLAMIAVLIALRVIFVISAKFRDPADRDALRAASSFGVVLVSIGLLAGICHHGLTCLEIAIAPKVYLLEWAAEVMK
jgi:hypothetical protein